MQMQMLRMKAEKSCSSGFVLTDMKQYQKSLNNILYIITSLLYKLSKQDVTLFLERREFEDLGAYIALTVQT